MLLPEIIDHILYFTDNSVFDLCLVNKYFNINVKKIRITNNKKYPEMKDEHLASLPNLTELDCTSEGTSDIIHLLVPNLPSEKLKITNYGISKLTQLLILKLGSNDVINKEGISCLTNLKTLDIAGNRIITNDGISNLTKLINLNLACNDSITSIKGLTGLKTLNLSCNRNITNEDISGLTNLQVLNLNYNHMISDISSLNNLKVIYLKGNLHIIDVSSLNHLEILYVDRYSRLSVVNKNVEIVYQ